MPKRLDIADANAKRWQELYIQDGYSLYDIAIVYGCSKNTVRDRLIKLGVVFDKIPRISRKAVGRPSPRKGVSITESQRLALGVRALGNKYCVGRKHSEETRAKISASLAKRPKRDPAIAIETDIKRQKFKNVLKSLLRAVKTKKHAKTEAVLGYSRAQLVSHIEGQFSQDMSWGDPKSFSIDHRIPVAEFIRRGVTDPMIVCALANLQPLPPKENRIKSDSYHGDFEKDLEKISFSIPMRQELLTARFSPTGTSYSGGLA